MSKIIYRDTKDGLQHVVLQTMACTLHGYNYNEIRKIYESYNLRVTPIEKNAKTWLEEGWALGDKLSRYTGSSKVRINLELWVDVMFTVKPGDLEVLLEYSKNNGRMVSAHMQHFLKSFCLFAAREPFEDDLKRVPWPILTEQQPEVKKILESMVQRLDCKEFVRHLPGSILTQLYFTEHVNQWLELKPVADIGLVTDLFFENPFIKEERQKLMYDAYLYNVEFLQTGKLADIMQRMTDGGEYQRKLRAIQKLHEGNSAEALAILTQLLKETEMSIFEEPLTNFVYAIALGLSIANPPTSRAGNGLRKTAETLAKSRKAVTSDSCYALRLVIYHYVLGSAAEFYRQNPLKNYHDVMCRHLAALFLYHYQILDQDPPAVSEAADNVISCGYDYLRLLYSFDYDELKPVANYLQEQTGLSTSLLPKVKRLAQWERTLEELLKLNRPATASKAKAEYPAEMEIERVAYLVNMNHYDVQPKLQKSKDGGVTWSKGRNIALRTFEGSRANYMTAQDRAVARMVQSYSYGWYGEIAFKLSGIGVVAALAGCQSVYDAFTEQRIDIVEESLQLSVDTCPNGYFVHSNADLNHLDSSSGICLTREGNSQVTIVRVNAKQKQTLELLRDVGVFPYESKKKLAQLLQNLSGSMTVMSPLLKNSTDLKRIEVSSLIAVQIAPAASATRFYSGGSMPTTQLFSISLAVKPFGNAGGDSKSLYQQPAQGMEIVSTKINGERVQTERNLKAEKQNLEALRQLMKPFEHEETDENRWLIDTAQCLQLLDTVRTASDICFVEWPQGVKMRVVRPVIEARNLRLKISSVGQWFELEGDVQIGDKEKLKMAELLEKLRSASGNFIRLSDDEYVALSEQLRRQLQAIDQMLTGRGKELKVAALNGMQLSALEEMGAKVKADEPFRQLMKRIEEAGQQQFALPANIHAELRPYQMSGYEWMSRLAYWGAGACLADDMGLGKTLQAITLMQSRAAQGPQLVIMPTSLLHNWVSELNRFAPALSVKLLNQQQGANRQQIVTDAEPADIVLATYGLLVTEGELLSQRTWTTIVLDEAHTIKNRDTQTSKAAMELKGDFRLMLTGTPLQNHLNEIWSLFQFANPGLLGSYQQFTDRFILPVERDHDAERQRLLRRLLSPFLLRRTKDDVLNELPEKTEITLRVELSAEEQALYDNLRQQAIANLEEGTKSPLQVLAEITRLRQAACHPRLINQKLDIPSSKTQAFLSLVEELHQSGHRALVFSQFTSHLALIREALDNSPLFGRGAGGKGSYLYLDGSTTPSDRDRLVRQFQTGSEPLFLISLKAGGLGLNLTAADYVIHLDPWWNPAIEDQASDRAHRIGQERPVTVYRLISAGTIEEKIIRLHQDKRSMADALLQDANLHSNISAKDIIRLLREGVSNAELRNLPQIDD